MSETVPDAAPPEGETVPVAVLLNISSCFTLYRIQCGTPSPSEVGETVTDAARPEVGETVPVAVLLHFSSCGD